jgi:hypothetical protein
MTNPAPHYPFSRYTLADLVAVRHTFSMTSLERCGLDEAVEEEIVRRIMELQGEWKDWEEWKKARAAAKTSAPAQAPAPAPMPPPPPPPADE